MTVAIGCTGGKHRSVAIAEALMQLLEPEAQPNCRCGCCTGIWVANERQQQATASSRWAAGTACTRRCPRPAG